MTRVGRASVFVATAIVAATSFAAQQPQPPRFRSSVEVVRLDVTVLDKQRRPIRDLKREDFTVLVDGVEQPIVAFDAVVIPPVDHTRAAWTREVSADVRDNQIGEPRIFIIVLDDARTPHTDLWMVRTGEEIARAIVDEMRQGDLAAVVLTFNTRHAQDLTGDRAKLLAAIEKFSPQGGVPGAHAMVWSTIDNLFKVMRQRSLGARAAIMWISPEAPGPGALRIDRGFGEQREDVFALISDINQLARQARVSNLPFYGFNIAGLVAPAAERPVAPSLNDSAKAFHYTYRDVERVNDSLKYLAGESGGRAVVNTNAPVAAVPDVINELSAYYVLGYRATYPMTDRKTRRIRIRVNHPDALVFPDDRAMMPVPQPRPVKVTPETPLLLAMSDILPDRGIPLKLATAPVATTTKSRTGVALALGVRQPGPDEPQSERFEVLTRIFTADGRAISRIAHSADVKWARAGIESQYELLSLLDLKPGRYLLRTSVHSASRGKTGSVYADFTVPNFRKERLSLSGVALTALPAMRQAPREALADVLPSALTAEREFTQAHKVEALVRIYQAEKKSIVPVVFHASVTDTAGEEIWGHTEALPPSRFGTRHAADARLALPIAKLPAGEYLLTIQATAGERRAETPKVRFSVAR